MENNPANNYVNRRMIRIRVLQALYANLLTEGDPTETFDLMLKEYLETIRKHERKRGDHGDSQFLLALYFESFNNKEPYDQHIQRKAANWELDRIAVVDRILLHMALCEILNFEEIPVKVTINEYLEIAKKFSTPKSSNFLNGILDSLYLEFKESGVLNKTGRGLIEYSVPRKPQTRNQYQRPDNSNQWQE